MKEEKKIITEKDFIDLIEGSPILSLEFKHSLFVKYKELLNNEIKEIITILSKQEKIFYGEIKSIKIKESLLKIKKQEKSEKNCELLQIDSILDTL